MRQGPTKPRREGGGSKWAAGPGGAFQWLFQNRQNPEEGLVDRRSGRGKGTGRDRAGLVWTTGRLVWWEHQAWVCGEQ